MYNTTEDGWLIYNDTHYLINNDKLDMESARAVCRKGFGDLVVITGESERKFLWRQARNSQYNFPKQNKKTTYDMVSKTDLMLWQKCRKPYV